MSLARKASLAAVKEGHGEACVAQRTTAALNTHLKKGIKLAQQVKCLDLLVHFFLCEWLSRCSKRASNKLRSLCYGVLCS